VKKRRGVPCPGHFLSHRTRIKPSWRQRRRDPHPADGPIKRLNPAATDIFEANQLILQELQPYNHGKVEETASLTNNVGIGEGTTIHGRTTIRGPVVIGEHCEIGPNTYIGPYTSIGDHATIRNTEIENTIIMSGALIDCGKRVTDSLIGKNVEIIDSNQSVPKGHKLILGDQSTVTL
jgi:glucose-1-phosphate thymidylyltransferase